MNTQTTYSLEATIDHPTDGGFVWTGDRFESNATPKTYESVAEAKADFDQFSAEALKLDGFADQTVCIHIIEIVETLDDDGDIFETLDWSIERREFTV